ncbi:hypothetical protein Alg130_06191 [Pyrenophora tritici-repentis]|nr:hypothetical protein Alg130_06191 [Pyrenophora tritici-repentis]KAI0609578.1 hypothetical protein TUN205_06152 [Pyrenophora tritici-repentis]PZD36360.1 hypothetical protein A1F96_00235 [Pyrenophora tritici-repentis]
MATETDTCHRAKAVTTDDSDHSADPESTKPNNAHNSTTLSAGVAYPELDGTDLSLARKHPYVVGLTAIATRHEPHQPFGLAYVTDYTKYLKITAVIRPSCNRGAQVVVVNDDMVAKIYDPLFYDSCDDSVFGEDVVTKAHCDYSYEAAAYQELQKSPAAQELIPAFYGTWTIDIDTLKREGDQLCKYTRQVPVLLIEYVRGFTMTDLDPRMLNEQMRTSVVKKALEADSIIYDAGVNHGDMHPRNIVIVGFRSDLEDGAPKEAIIKVIDFNVAHLENTSHDNSNLGTKIDGNDDVKVHGEDGIDIEMGETEEGVWDDW